MNWPTLTAGILSEHQVEHLGKATSRKLGILGGSPGTGKTFAVAQVVKQLGELIGYSQIATAAPTGKAAVRLSEAMNLYGIPLRARTIHSLLKVESSTDGWTFAFNHSNRLPCKAIVVDESSMIDTDLAASLFAARARGTLMLIVGDVNQLPPVGHGAPLRDMIAAGVPYGELRVIRRQQDEGGIVQACADIRDGKPFKCEGNLRMVAADGPEKQKALMLDTIEKAARHFGCDPVWDIQVLCAVNKASDISRRELNKILQNALNPNPSIKGSPFRMADKVVNTKNNLFKLLCPHCEGQGFVLDAAGRATPCRMCGELERDDKGRVYVANGELGEVISVLPGCFWIRLSSPDRLVLVPRGQVEETTADEDPAGDEEGNVEEKLGTGCDWDLGYSISTHKSQGSEWKITLVMLDESGGAKRVCSREWLYTAISRAKQCCALVGNLSTAHGFCKRTVIDKRKTFLMQRIIAGMEKF